MSNGPNKVSTTPIHGAVLAGLIVSSIALVGWLIMLALIFATPYEAYTQDASRNLVIGLGNFLNYLSRVFVGVVGMFINGMLSLIGTVMCAMSLNYEPRQRAATIGLVLGLVGLFIGAGVLLWRALFWFAVLNG